MPECGSDKFLIQYLLIIQSSKSYLIFQVKPAVCPLRNPENTTTITPFQSKASPRNGECEDSPDCAENGIVDIIGCDFTSWANDRCPMTCGTCGLATRVDDREKNEVNSSKL